MLGERRLALIRELSLREAVCQTVSLVLQSVEKVLARAESDVPFALLYEPAKECLTAACGCREVRVVAAARGRIVQANTARGHD